MAILQSASFYVYLRGYVLRPNKEKDLHLRKILIQDLNAFTDDDAVSLMADFEKQIAKKSEGTPYDVSFVSKDEYYGLGGPIAQIIG